MGITIAVFGVSGVGKSHLAARVAAYLGYLHIGASFILRQRAAQASGMAPTQEELRLGAVLGNQAPLIAGFRELRAAEPRPILFDGHNLVDGSDGIVEIPLAVIRELEPDGIVVVRADPATIRKRRSEDVSRVRPDRTEQEITAHQERAIQLAREHADTLSVPVAVVDSGDEAGFRQAVEAISRRFVT